MRLITIARLAVTVGVAGLLVSGCSGPDKAGGAAGGVVTTLRFENTNVPPPAQLQAFADEVAKRSHETVKIVFVESPHAADPELESQLVNDVRQGTVDLAWVGPRVFDTFGVTSFQPLLAPMLIDSEQLEGRVFDSGIPDQMLADITKVGVVGVGVTPGPLRRPLSKGEPLTSPDAFRGKVFGINSSKLTERAFAQLGATTKHLGAGPPLDTIDGIDMQVGLIWLNHYEDRGAKSIVGNLNLWPRPLTIIAAPKSWSRLTPGQQQILTDAAQATRAAALDASRAEDTANAADLCKSGMTITAATPAQLAQFRTAFQPVYDQIAATNPTNKARLQQIQGLKDATGAAPDSITCATARSATSETQPGDPQAHAATIPEGVTFTMTLTPSDWDGCEGGADQHPTQIDDMVFRDGYVYIYVTTAGSTERTLGNKDTYSTFHDRLGFGNPADGTVKWKVDGNQLILSDSNAETCGERIIITKHPWTRK
ncbi:hypothetical protein GCM10027053_25510 [Intrasporangium mesophilum]